MATITRRTTVVDLNPKRKRSLVYKATEHHSDAYTKTEIPTPPRLPRQRPVLIPIHTNVRPIRRLPSRMPSARLITTSLRSASHSSTPQSPANAPLVGRKRKRGIPNGNENYDGVRGLSAGGAKGSLKRSKSAYGSLGRDMDLDLVQSTNGHRRPRTNSTGQEPVSVDSDGGEDELDSSDDHYLTSAPQWQLQKLRKEDLIRLFEIAVGSAAEDDEVTKNDLISGIIKARKNSAGSQNGRTRSARSRSPASPYTDGHDAGAEESDLPTEENDRKRLKTLRRSATTQTNLGLGQPSTQVKRSKSMNFAERRNQAVAEPARRTRLTSEFQGSTTITTRRRSANNSHRPSPSSAAASGDDVFLQRPKRSRESSKLARDSKGKAKHVRYIDEILPDDSESADQVTEDDEKDEDWEDEAATPTRTRRNPSKDDVTPTRRRSNSLRRRETTLARSETKSRVFSPKKLRPRASKMASVTNLVHLASQTAARRPSGLGRNSRKAAANGAVADEEPSEDDLVDDDDDEQREEADGEQTDESADDTESQNEEVDELMDDETEDQQMKSLSQAEDESDLTELTDSSDHAEEDEDEEDNFGSQAEESPAEDTPRPARTRSRKRSTTKSVPSPPQVASPRRKRSELTIAATRPRRQGSRTLPKDEPVEENVDSDEEQYDTPDEGGEDEEAIEEDAVPMEQSEAEPDTEPRVLRNGKVVGGAEEEEDQLDEESAADEDAAMEEDEGEAEEDVDVDVEEDLEDAEVATEPDEEAQDELEDEFDLSEATAKSLVRLRRDDLVRLCETRDLEAEGTKVQLVQSLLEWRDQVAHAPSSSTQPSSYASTVRAPSTFRPRGDAGSPVLLRTDRVHVTQPRTPDPDPDAESIILIGSKGKDKDRDGDELELDLESLGLEEKEIPADKLTKLEKIGSGGFKDVFIGKYRGRRVAIAEFRGHLGPMDIKELKLLSDFKHPNVVKFLGVSIPEDARSTPVMMVSELCANGDLFDYIRNVPAPPLKIVISLMLDIARGIDYLHNIHKPSVIHRDCKSSNILITKQVTAKIADFGLAKVKQSTRSMVKSLVGTVNWQAPELWHPHPKYDYKVDIFSLAMVFWEILQWKNPSKKYPWEGMNEHAIYDEVGAKKHRPSVSGLRKQWCPEVVDLVEKMWRHDPKERPPISEVVQELERLLALQ